MALNLINPIGKYDHKKESNRDKFVNAMDNISDLEKWAQGIQENPDSSNIREDIGSLIYDKPDFFTKRPAEEVMAQIHKAYTDSIEHLGGYTTRDKDGLHRQKGYVENNFDDMTDRLDANGLSSMALNVTLMNTGNKNTDSAIKNLRELQEIQRLDEKTIHPFLGKKMKEEPKHISSFYFEYGQKDDFYAQKFAEYISRKTQKELAKSMEKVSGTSERDKFKTIIDSSLDAIEDFYGDIEHLGDKSNFFEDIWRPYYTTLAKIVHPLDKKIKKLDEDKDRVKRKEKLRKLTTN